MAGNGEVSVRVPIDLEIMNNSLADVKKVIDSLSPNTKNFNALQSIVKDMEKSAQSFAQKMAVPFKSKSQFTSASKDLDKFMAQMEKFNQLRAGLTLDNFKVIDPEALQQIQQLKQELENAQQEIVKIQQKTLQGLFSDITIKESLIKIDPSITEKSFEEVEQIVSGKIDEINDKISEIGTKSTKSIQIRDRLKEIVGKDFISPDVLGEDIFNQFFKKNGAFKSGQQNPFLEYLKDTFNLSPQQIQDLTDKTASQINEILNKVTQSGNREFFKPQRGAATRAENQNKKEIQEYEAQRDLLSDVQIGMDLASASMEKYKEKIQETNKEIQKTGENSKKVASDSLTNNYNQMTSAVESYKASLESANTSLMKLSRQQMTFNSLKSAITNFMGFAQVANMVKKAWSDATKHIKELDTVMNGISIVTDMSTADLWDQVDAYTQLAQKYGTTIKGAYEVSQIYYQQGLKSNEVMELTEETLKLSKISGLDYATTTDYMTTALRGFHMEMSEASRVVDVYSNLAANTAVSQQELAEAMTRTASSMEAVGTTFEESSAMIATIVAATRESASNIGSAMKSIASRYGELTKDPTALIDSEGEEMSFNKVDTALKSIGISMQTADHQFRDFTDVILELSDAWDTLDSRQQRYIATQMAGNRQQSRFLALVSNGIELRQNLEIAENSEGTGSQQAQKYLESLEAKINQVQTAWQEFYTTIGIEDAWKAFLDSTTKVLNTLNHLPKLFNTLPVNAINAIVNIVNAIKTVAGFALSQLAKLIMPHIIAAGQAAEQVSKQEGQKGGAAYRKAYTEQLRKIKGGIAGQITSGIATAGGAISSLTLLMDQSTKQAKELAGTIGEIGAALQIGGGFAQLWVPGQRLMGVMNLLSGIISLNSAISIKTEDLEERANTLKNEVDILNNRAQELKSNERALTSFKNKYEELEKKRYDSEEAAQEFQDAMNEIAEKFPELVSSYDTLGNATIEVTDLEEHLAEIRMQTAQANIDAAEAEIQYQKVKAEIEKKSYQVRAQRQSEQNQTALKQQYGYALSKTGLAEQVPWIYRFGLQVGKNDGSLEDILNKPTTIFSSGLTDDQWLANALAGFLNVTVENLTNDQMNHLRDLSHLSNGTQDLEQLIQYYKNVRSQEPKAEYNGAGEILDTVIEHRTNLQSYNKKTQELLKATYDYDTPEFDELYQEWYNEFNKSYYYMSEAEFQLAEEIVSSIKSAQAGTATSIETIKSLEKIGVKNALNILINDKDNGIVNLQNSELYSVLTHKLLSGVSSRKEGVTITDYVKQYLEDIWRLDEWLGQLDYYTREKLEARLKDRQHYNTAADLFDGILNVNDEESYSEIIALINEYYNPEEIRALAQQKVEATATELEKQYRSGTASTINTIPTDLIDSAIEQQFNNQLIDFITVVSKYNPGWDVNLEGLVTGFSQLNNELKDTIVNNGISSIENIDKSIDALKEAGYDDNSDIVKGLEALKKQASENILLSLQTEIDAYTKGADTAISNIKKLQSGVGFEDLSKIITTLNQYLTGAEKLTVADFNFVDGNWTAKINSFSKITTGYTKQMQAVDDHFNEQMKAYDTATDLLKQIDAGGQITDVKALTDAGITIEDYLSLGNDKVWHWRGSSEADKAESKAQLEEALSENKVAAENSKAFYDAYVTNYNLMLKDMTRDLKRVDKTLSTIISNRQDLSLTDIDKLGQQLNIGGYQEMIDQGFVSFIGGRLTMTASQLQKTLDQAKENENLSVDQINTYQAEITKIAQETSVEAALSSIISSPDKVTEDMLTAWANALHTSVENIRDLFIKNADGKTYTVKDVDSLIQLEGMNGTEAADKYYQSLRDTTKNVYTAFVNAVSTGQTQYLDKTSANSAQIESLRTTLEQNGIIITEKYGQYVINAINANTQGIITLLENSDLDKDEQSKQIDTLLKAEQSKNFDNIFSSILKNTKNISRDTMQKLADFYGVSVQALLDTKAFNFNEITDSYEVGDTSQLKDILVSAAGKITHSAYRMLEAQLYSLENEFTGSAMSFLSNTSIKETDVADIFNKYVETLPSSIARTVVDAMSLPDFIEKYFIRDLNGGLQIKDNAALKEIGTYFGLTEDQIASALATRISKIISNFGTLANEANNGFDSLDKANAILQDVRASGFHTDFNYMFEYSESLHKFIYTNEGIMLRVQQLREQLESGATELEKQQAASQLDQFMTQMGQKIDIVNYRSLGSGTIEYTRARNELVRNVSNYNAAAQAAGKATISADLVNEAVLGNINSIIELYTLLGKDLTSDQLVTIYQQPVTEVQNAMSQLETIGINSLIDGTTAMILELSGAISTTNSEIEGKYKVTDLHFDQIATAYSTMYDVLENSGKATTQQLNEVLFKMISAQTGKNQAGIDALKSAASMSIEQFGNLLVKSGITLTKDFLTEQNEWSKYVTLLGGDSLQITDFEGLAKAIGWDTTSEAYKTAYKSYVDSMIQQGNSMRDNILSITNSLETASIGDKINVSSLGLDEDLFDNIENGILTVTDDITNIINAILDNPEYTKFLNTYDINKLQRLSNRKTQNISQVSAAKTLLDNWDNASYSIIETFAKSIGADTEDIIAQLFTERGDGSFIGLVEGKENFARQFTSKEIVAEYMNNLRQTKDSIYSSITTAFTSGEVQYVADSAEVRRIIEEDGLSNVAKFSEIYGQWVIDTAALTTEEMINLLQSTDQEQNVKVKNIDSILQSEREKTFDNVFSTILQDTKTISYQTMNNLATILNTSVDSLLDSGAFKFNDFTKGYEVDKNYLLSILQTQKGSMDEMAYTMLEAQLYSMKNTFSGEAMSLISSGNIKETDVASLVQKFYEETGENILGADGLFGFINEYFTRDLNGNLQFKDSQAMHDFAVQFDLSSEQINSLMFNQLSKTISNMTTFASEATGGFSSLDKAEAVYQDILNSGYGNDQTFYDLFDYSEKLKKYVYTTTGIALRAHQLKEQLEQESGEADSSEAINQFMAQLGQSIDIIGYAQLAIGSKEQETAREELLRNVLNYNAAAAELDQIPIEKETIEAAINGDIYSIVQLYDMLGKTVTTDQLVTIYKSKANDIQNMIDIVSNNGVGDLIDTTYANFLQLTGIITASTTDIEGKSKIEAVNFDNLATAYSTLYDVLSETTGATTKQLNDTILKMVNAQVSKEQTGIDALSNATSMTFDQFSEYLTQSGVTLTKTFLQDYGEYITLLGGNKLQISNFEGLAAELGWDTSSQAYQDTYKSYVDSMITQNNSMRERITSLTSWLETATEGEQFNVAGLGLDDMEGVENGILTLSENVSDIVYQIIEAQGEYLTNYEKNRLLRIAEGTSSKNATTAAAKTLVDNWDNASYDAIETFAKALGVDVKKFQKDLFSEENFDGTFKGDANLKIAFAREFLGDKAAADLSRELNKTLESTYSEVIESVISSIKNGEQKITITDNNRAILEWLANEKNYGRIESATNEYIIDILDKNFDDFITLIQNAPDKSDTQKRQWISQLYQQRQSNTNTAIFKSLVDNASNLDYDLVARADVFTEISEKAIKFNEDTQSWFLDLQELSTLLENTTADELGIDETTYNTLKAKVLAESESKTPLSLGKQMISSKDNISKEMYANFLNSADITSEQLMKYLIEEGDHYKFKSNREAMSFAKAIGMTKEEIFKTFTSGIINDFNGLSNGIARGFTDVSAMQQIVDTINNSVYSSQANQTIDSLFEYNDSLNAFMLSTSGISAYIRILKDNLNKATDEGQKSIIEGQIQSLTKQLKDSISFDSIFSSNQNQTTIENNRKKLVEQLNQLYAASSIKDREIIKNSISTLFNGGSEAVQAASDLYKLLGREFTDEEAEKFRQSNLSKIKDAREALDKGLNSYITTDAAAIGKAAGYFEVGNEVDGLVQILKVNKDKLEDALKLYYAALLNNGQADVSELNEAVLSIWDEQGRKAAGGVDLLTKGDMTYREFGEGLIAAGINLTSDMLDQFEKENLIKKIAGTDKIRIKDFDAFASRIGITDKSSQVYKDAYSTFVDNTIKDVTRTRTDIISAMSSIQSAKAGDQLNITNAMSAFDEKTQYALALRMQNLGAEYNEGILKISKDSNLLQIAQLIGEAAQKQGVELEQTMLELADSIQKAVQGYIDAIVSGLEGGITNAGKSELLTLTKQLELDGLLKETDFIQTANGMKIATSAAIDLYNALNELADVNVDTSKLFEGISESIMSRDEISTMDGIMAKIANLQRQISENQNKQTGNVEQTNAALQKELALYQQIARNSMSDPNKYKFMEQALPDKYQGAVNFWQNSSTMLTSMVQGAKTGYMSIQDFYNTVTAMQNMADQSGKDMSFMGYTLKAGMDTASTLIEAGFSNFGTTAEHAGDINLKGLSGLGVNLQMSAKDMAAGVEDGIHSIAKSQVDMLDAAIKVLETIVAMEGISDAIDGDGLNLTLDDIFEIDDNGDQKLKSNIQKAIDQCLKAAEGNETIKKYLNNIKIGQFSIGQILEDLKDGEINTEGLTDEIALNALKLIKFLNSQDAFGQIEDPQDIFDTLRTLNIPGLRIDVQEGNTEFTLVHGRYIYKDKNGKWEGISEDQEEAYKQLKTQELAAEIDNLNKNRIGKDRLITIDEKKEYPYIINFKNGTSIQLKYDSEDGGIITSDGNKYTDFSEALNKEMYAQVEELTKNNKEAKHGASGILYKDMQTWQLRLAFGIDIAPTISNPKDLTPEMMARLLAQDIDNVDEIIEAGEYKLGFKINPEMTEAEKNDWNEALKHLNEVDLKVKPINADEIKVDGYLHVKAVVDELINGKDTIQIKTSNGTTKTIPAATDLFTDGGPLRQEDREAWEKSYWADENGIQKYYSITGKSLATVTGISDTFESMRTILDTKGQEITSEQLTWAKNTSVALKELGYDTQQFDELITEITENNNKVPKENAGSELVASYVFANANGARTIYAPSGKLLNTPEGLQDAFNTYSQYAGMSNLTPELQNWMSWFGETITKANKSLGSYEERVKKAEEHYQKDAEGDSTKKYSESQYFQSAAKYADVFFKYYAGSADNYYKQVRESVAATHPGLDQNSQEFKNLVGATFAHDVHTWLDNGGWNAIYGTDATSKQTATEKATAATQKFTGAVEGATTALETFTSKLLESGGEESSESESNYEETTPEKESITVKEEDYIPPVIDDTNKNSELNQELDSASIAATEKIYEKYLKKYINKFTKNHVGESEIIVNSAEITEEAESNGDIKTTDLATNGGAPDIEPVDIDPLLSMILNSEGNEYLKDYNTFEELIDLSTKLLSRASEDKAFEDEYQSAALAVDKKIQSIFESILNENLGEEITKNLTPEQKKDIYTHLRNGEVDDQYWNNHKKSYLLDQIDQLSSSYATDAENILNNTGNIDDLITEWDKLIELKETYLSMGGSESDFADQNLKDLKEVQEYLNTKDSLKQNIEYLVKDYPGLFDKARDVTYDLAFFESVKAIYDSAREKENQYQKLTGENTGYFDNIKNPAEYLENIINSLTTSYIDMFDDYKTGDSVDNLKNLNDRITKYLNIYETLFGISLNDNRGNRIISDLEKQNQIAEKEQAFTEKYKQLQESKANFDKNENITLQDYDNLRQLLTEAQTAYDQYISAGGQQYNLDDLGLDLYDQKKKWVSSQPEFAKKLNEFLEAQNLINNGENPTIAQYYDALIKQKNLMEEYKKYYSDGLWHIGLEEFTGGNQIAWGRLKEPFINSLKQQFGEALVNSIDDKELSNLFDNFLVHGIEENYQGDLINWFETYKQKLFEETEAKLGPGNTGTLLLDDEEYQPPESWQKTYGEQFLNILLNNRKLDDLSSQEIDGIIASLNELAITSSPQENTELLVSSINELIAQLNLLSTEKKLDNDYESRRQQAGTEYEQAIETYGINSEQARQAWENYVNFIREKDEGRTDLLTSPDERMDNVTEARNNYEEAVSQIFEIFDGTNIENIDFTAVENAWNDLQNALELIGGIDQLPVEDAGLSYTLDELKNYLNQQQIQQSQDLSIFKQKLEEYNSLSEKYSPELSSKLDQLYNDLLTLSQKYETDDFSLDGIPTVNDLVGQFFVNHTDEMIENINSLSNDKKDELKDAMQNILDAIYPQGSDATTEVPTIISDVNESLSNLSNSATNTASKIETAASNIDGRDVNASISVNGSTIGEGTHTYNIQTNILGATNGLAGATGRAFASGTRTLMGELGPELVVSNGRYFLAGQNGAEFVDLDKDAIVFNHIQTKRLLANGSSGRGIPLTNERNATSMATGNVRGPAQASASSALATLKKLRAEWDAIANLPIADLAKKGGGGGGGGDKQIPGFIRDVERWYNWLQKIADLEKEITYQEQLRSKIQSDMVSSGKAYYASQRKTYQELRDSALTSESLYLSQKDYFEKRREQLNSEESPLSQLYTFDETGQLHFKDGTYEWLANLFKTGDYGQIGLTPKQQYETILSYNKEFANFMKYDESGKEIVKKDFKSDDEYYLAMVKAFSERMDSEKEEMQKLFDSWHEQEQAVLEQMQAMNEQLQAMKDNQKEVEDAVVKAIEETRQRAIDEMKDTKDALQKTNEDFIDGLTKSLEKERQMYEDKENDQELERNRRQLAILQRSGASAAQIASLQEKIQQQAQDQYFQKQQEQIDAVKEASDLQIERMDTQIELAQEQLDYEKAHGLLWGQVYDVMSKSAQDIAAFIQGNTEEWWSKSPLATTEDANDLIFKTEQWEAFRKDTGMQEAALGKINQNLDIFLAAMKEIHGKDAKWDEIEKTAKAKYETLFSEFAEDPGKTAWEAYYSAAELATKPKQTKGTTSTTTGTGSGSGKDGVENKWYVDENKGTHYKKYWAGGKWTRYEEGPHIKVLEGTEIKKAASNGKNTATIERKYKCSKCNYQWGEIEYIPARTDGGQNPIEDGKSGDTSSSSSKQQVAVPTGTIKDPGFTFVWATEDTYQRSTTKLESGEGKTKEASDKKKIKVNAKGGIADYTGLAWLDGTPTEPEAILNAQDYKDWKNQIKTTTLLYNALSSVHAAQAGIASASSYTSNDSGINIENAVVNMNATISNDYDARRAGEQALEQMLSIARKSGTRSVPRG